MKISIIIPIYNAEKTIKKCLDSIFNNSFQDFEVILINDGSKDDSLKVIQEYSQLHEGRLRIYDQENKGVAVTRNRGIEYAQGEYICFIDNDDFIDCDYLEKFYNEIQSSESDLVIGGYRRVNNVKTLFEVKLQNKEEWSKYMIMAPWAKIYRKDFLLENNITFLENNIGEDVYFNLTAINCSSKIKIFDYVGYNWFDNSNSVSNTIQRKVENKLNVMHLLNACHSRLSFLKVADKCIVEYYFIRYVVWYLLFSGRKSSTRSILVELDKTFAWLNEKYPHFLKNELLGLFKPKGENLTNKIAVYLFVLLYRFNLIKVFLKVYSK